MMNGVRKGQVSHYMKKAEGGPKDLILPAGLGGKQRHY